MKGWLAIIALLCAAQAWGQAHDEGIAAGRAANPTIRAFVSTPSASSVVPGYTTTPPETGYYGLPSLAAPAAALIAQCRTAPPGDVRCQAIITAHDSAANPHPPVAATDPAVVAATTIANDPSSILGAITGSYSACGTQQRLVSPPTFDQQSCYDYYRRAQNQLCQKTLTVRVDWSCPAGDTGPNATFNPVTGDNDYTCTETTTHIDYTCPAGYDLFVAPTGESLCREQANPTNTIPATPVTVTVTQEVPAIATETDLWDNPCSGFEARVPPGLLPPDGVALPPGAQALGPGVLDKCQRTTSTCSDAVPATRRINSKDVTRACWQWTNSFDCVDLDPTSDCSQPRFGQCAALGPPRCIDQDAFFSPPVCTAWRSDFQCQTRGPVYDTVADCGTQQFCSEGTCWDTGHPPDADFARTVTLLEAQREAGKYLDVNALRVFKGFDNRCDKKLFGLVNCCNRGGTSASGLFSNLSLILSASGQLGRAGFSSYTYDALFTSDAPNLVVSGFEALFGTGLDSGLAGILAGDLSVADFVISLGARTMDAGHAGHPVLRVAVVPASATGDRDEARRPPVRGLGRVLLAASADHSHLHGADAHLLLLQLAARPAHQRARARATRPRLGDRRSSLTAAASRWPNCRRSTSRAWTSPSSTPKSRRPCPTRRTRSTASPTVCRSATSGKANANAQPRRQSAYARATVSRRWRSATIRMRSRARSLSWGGR